MKKPTSAIAVATLLALALLCIVPIPASSLAISVGPSTLEIKDALRGMVYERQIIVANPDQATTAYSFSAMGEAASWISFADPSNTDEPIGNVSIPAGKQAPVIVKVAVPQDAANGEHKATVIVATVPAVVDGGGSGQVVGLLAPVEVTITVTGIQIVSGNVTSIGVTDAEVKYPVRIRVQFYNTGNVVVAPQVVVKITAENGAPIDDFTFGDVDIKPGNSGTISGDWDTTGREPGNYTAEVSIVLNNDVIRTEKLNFAILPVGTATRAGTLGSLELQNEPELGVLAIIAAKFTNTGQIDTKAKFTGEVYSDGRLVNAIASEEILVPVARTETLKSYVKLETTGNYRITCYVNYEGKKTESKEISFTVGSGGGVGRTETGGQFPLSTPVIVVIAIAAALAAGISIALWRRGRHKKLST